MDSLGRLIVRDANGQVLDHVTLQAEGRGAWEMPRCLTWTVAVGDDNFVRVGADHLLVNDELYFTQEHQAACLTWLNSGMLNLAAHPWGLSESYPVTAGRSLALPLFAMRDTIVRVGGTVRVALFAMRRVPNKLAYSHLCYIGMCFTQGRPAMTPLVCETLEITDC
jgi:hypothetical protein